jgi:phosphatidylglycerol lysyltransferase
MRHAPGAPNGVMDFLLAKLMQWAAREGFQWFALGMAPLSGFMPGEQSPIWSRVGALVYRHGERFYNFRGLRRYKEKFQPVWEPRYLAGPSGFALPRVLTNVTTLVAGSVAGVVRK